MKGDMFYESLIGHFNQAGYLLSIIFSMITGQSSTDCSISPLT